jgi:hypothetical protein
MAADRIKTYMKFYSPPLKQRANRLLAEQLPRLDGLKAKAGICRRKMLCTKERLGSSDNGDVQLLYGCR